MELKHIEAFLTVVDKGSFSAAADALFITQPTISIRIQHLEKALNTTLFKRTHGKKVFLTPTGKQILPYFKEAFQLIQQGTSLIQQSPDGLQQQIYIACPNHMGAEIMPELLRVLYDMFPTIDFPIKIGKASEIIDDFRNHQVDVGFIYLHSEEDVHDLPLIRIANERNILVSSPDHPLTQFNAVSAGDLKNERIIIYSKTFLTTNIIEQYFQKNSLKAYKTVEINNLGWIKMMVRKGLGIAFLQKMIVHDELKSGALVELPMNKTLPPLPIYLIFQPTVPENIKVQITQTTKKMFALYEL